MLKQILCGCSLASLLASSANATTFCVTTGAQLKAALAVADSNNQSDVIRLASGFYAYPGPGTFDYSPLSSENHDLDISGGWSALASNPCGQQVNSDAFDTVITTDAAVGLMSISLPDNAIIAVTIRRLTFLGGDSAGAGGGLNINSSLNAQNGITVTIDQCAFVGNRALRASALHAFVSGTLRVSNTLFSGNHSLNAKTAELAALGISPIGVYVTNTSFVDNTDDISIATQGVPNGAGLHVFVTAPAQALIANNNLWGNDGFDLSIGGDGNLLVRNNNIGTPIGTANEWTDNISVTPQYESGELNYTPISGSLLRDTGTLPPVIAPTPRPFDDNWSTGARDVLSRNRVRGSGIDIGAFEGVPDLVFASSFE